MRERFVELFKKAREASPIEKLAIEADLALIINELLNLGRSVRTLPTK
jgi:hypothetical protein